MFLSRCFFPIQPFLPKQASDSVHPFSQVSLSPPLTLSLLLIRFPPLALSPPASQLLISFPYSAPSPPTSRSLIPSLPLAPSPPAPGLLIFFPYSAPFLPPDLFPPAPFPASVSLPPAPRKSGHLLRSFQTPSAPAVPHPPLWNFAPPWLQYPFPVKNSIYLCFVYPVP